jgi:hypothetical protein
MFHPSLRAGAGQTAVAQVFDEARIADGEAAELGPGHTGLAKKAFYAADQHEMTSTANRGLDGVVVVGEILLV